MSRQSKNNSGRGRVVETPGGCSGGRSEGGGFMLTVPEEAEGGCRVWICVMSPWGRC